MGVTSSNHAAIADVQLQLRSLEFQLSNLEVQQMERDAVARHAAAVRAHTLGECVTLYGALLRCRQDVRIAIGPVMGAVDGTSAVVLLELNVGAVVWCNVCVADPSTCPEGRVVQRFAVKCAARRPTSFKVRRLTPGQRYFVCFGGVNRLDAERCTARFVTWEGVGRGSGGSLTLLLVADDQPQQLAPGAPNMWEEVRRAMDVLEERVPLDDERIGSIARFVADGGRHAQRDARAARGAVPLEEQWQRGWGDDWVTDPALRRRIRRPHHASLFTLHLGGQVHALAAPSLFARAADADEWQRRVYRHCWAYVALCSLAGVAFLCLSLCFFSPPLLGSPLPRLLSDATRRVLTAALFASAARRPTPPSPATPRLASRRYPVQRAVLARGSHIMLPSARDVTVGRRGMLEYQRQLWRPDGTKPRPGARGAEEALAELEAEEAAAEEEAAALAAAAPPPAPLVAPGERISGAERARREAAAAAEATATARALAREARRRAKRSALKKEQLALREAEHAHVHEYGRIALICLDLLTPAAGATILPQPFPSTRQWSMLRRTLANPELRVVVIAMAFPLIALAPDEVEALDEQCRASAPRASDGDRNPGHRDRGDVDDAQYHRLNELHLQMQNRWCAPSHAASRRELLRRLFAWQVRARGVRRVCMRAGRALQSFSLSPQRLPCSLPSALLRAPPLPSALSRPPLGRRPRSERNRAGRPSLSPAGLASACAP